MPEIIHECERRARVAHTCDYCGEVIEPGEMYKHAVLKNDDVYTWDAHKICVSIANDLWDFVDPYDGMTADDFQDACGEFCRMFICPDCVKWDKEAREVGPECEDRFCIDKIFDFLQTHDFKRVPNKHGYYGVWKCFPKEGTPNERK